MTGIEPATNGVNDISSLYALPLSYMAYRYIVISSTFRFSTCGVSDRH